MFWKSKGLSHYVILKVHIKMEMRILIFVFGKADEGLGEQYRISQIINGCSDCQSRVDSILSKMASLRAIIPAPSAPESPAPSPRQCYLWGSRMLISSGRLTRNGRHGVCVTSR
jgi:hypothetical protein